MNTNRNYHNAQGYTERMQNTNLMDYVSPFSNEQLGGPNSVIEQTMRGDFMDPNNPLIQNYLNAATRPVEENLI